MALPISSSYRIFWTGKYLERAEVLARLLDQKLLHTFDMSPAQKLVAWEELLKAFGVHTEYVRRHTEVSTAEVLQFFVLEEQSPTSILNSMHMARENISGSMPDDIFVVVNKLYLKLRDKSAAEALAKKPHEFLSEVIQTCMQVVGIVNRLWG
ncbi:MAG: hypothetical protein A3G34_11400 [Candidatus Lindowbacteria bacterium RIFCSPLOWO2_12_FULL_62_27]|nr:MAG: hypothetical protein A3I06_16330 [Candidatus Lindowbacteria bacterium RIFCSPLOWO2_02_FULL_62_12]OGH60717.1 MAG: hypothetical protein A3G34_11400 [Candidatus Lindowbacteria bacterium RIFCSPLOWO2_12_FULL_62_27]